MATPVDGANVKGLGQEALAESVLRVLGEVAGGEAREAAEVGSFREQSWVRLPPEHALEVLRRLKSDPELSMEMLVDLTCVHFPKRPAPLGAFDVVYLVCSLTKGHRIRLKVACPDPDEGVDSAFPVWSGANLLEREAYDMFGVNFRGHPDLRRILMDQNFDGWPMRKDFPFRGH
jgi:NADH-quinone oxidoreductase subunit C